jgi:hypothetical protein
VRSVNDFFSLSRYSVEFVGEAGISAFSPLETHPESPPGDWVREFLKEEFSGLLN